VELRALYAGTTLANGVNGPCGDLIDNWKAPRWLPLRALAAEVHPAKRPYDEAEQQVFRAAAARSMQHSA
jgi:hypothetical protein